MDDLISRQAAIEEKKRCESADSYDFNNGLIRAMNAIADIPSAQPRTKCIAEIKISKEDLDELVAEKVEEIKAAQPERKRGEWKDRGEDYMIRWICSECGRKETHVYNFCPDCGADMRGDENEID